ncbi:hypothetical protein [Vibrio sp. Hal054]|uniref:hypothetical protein n=1 Tax=Vibrio sp. Hal054 TaxID=3035158 RepID=UPI00301D6A3E
MMKLNRVLTVVGLLVNSNRVLAASNEDSTVSFLFRMAEVVHLGTITWYNGLLTSGVIAFIAGCVMIAKADSMNIPRKYGMVVCIAGSLLASPRGCQDMANRTLFESDTVEVYQDMDSGFITPDLN